MASIRDWLDVFIDPAGGPAVLKQSLLAGSLVVARAEISEPTTPTPAPPDGDSADDGEPPEPGGDEWDGKGDPPPGRILPADHIERAHKYLVDRWLSDDGRSLRLVAIGTRFFRYNRGTGAWAPVEDHFLLGRIKRWASPLRRRKVKREKGQDVVLWPPANITNTEAVDVLESVRLEVMVDLEGTRGEKGGIQPGRFWLCGTQMAAQRYRGAPVPVAEPWERIVTDPAAEGLPEAMALLPLSDGLLDLDAWDRCRVVRHAHTTRLFNLNRYPYTLPWRELQHAAEDAAKDGAAMAEDTTPGELEKCVLECMAGRVEEISRALAPRWWAFLRQALGAEPDPAALVDVDEDERNRQRVACALAYGEALRELAKFGGYVLGCDVRHHKGNLFMLVGPPGGGKGTIGRVITGLLGEGGSGNVVSLEIAQLGKQEYLHSCMGKALVYLPDERPHDLMEAREGGNVLKKIAGGDAVSFRALFNAPVTNVQLYCRFLMLCNEMPHLADEALVRRMIVVDMPRVAASPDLTLDDALSEPGERLGQLLWMLLGRLWLRADGRFVQPESSRAQLEVYEQEADKYGDFVAQCIEVTGNELDRVRPAEIAELYAAYAASEHGHTKFPTVDRVMAGVLPAMRKRWPMSQHQVRQLQPREQGKRGPRVYVGLVLTKDKSAFEPPAQPGAGQSLGYDPR